MKTYAIVGLGSRAGFYYTAIAGAFRATARLVAFCDTNQTRMDYANEVLQRLGHAAVPTYVAGAAGCPTPGALDQLVADTRPDVVLVTSIDRTHAAYIVRALALGCAVVTEKPLTVDAAGCAAILRAVAAATAPTPTPRPSPSLRVAFNYRYAPHNTAVRRLVAAGAIGAVQAVHLEWALDTAHGADYFRRWHRDKRNSGGLLVHKAAHHFDLVHWWLGAGGGAAAARPQTVAAFGDLRFYGRANAEARGEPAARSYARARDGGAAARADPFALHLDASEPLARLYAAAEHEDGYYRDQGVFADGISAEDTLAVLVRYGGGAVLAYSLVAYAPWEGFRVALTGTRGRLELHVVENAYVSAGRKLPTDPDADDDDDADDADGAAKSVSLTLHPQFAPPQTIAVPTAAGGHGGGDPQLLRDLFGGGGDDDKNSDPDPDGRAASHVDGAWSALVGIAANESMRTGQTVQVRDLVDRELLE